MIGMIQAPNRAALGLQGTRATESLAGDLQLEGSWEDGSSGALQAQRHLGGWHVPAASFLAARGEGNAAVQGHCEPCAALLL